MADVQTVLFQPCGILLKGHSLLLILCCQDHQNTLSACGCKGIHTGNLTFWILFHQVCGCQMGTLPGGSKTAGKGNIEDILALFQKGLKIIGVYSRGDLGGASGTSITKLVIEGFAVPASRVLMGMLLSI